MVKLCVFDMDGTFVDTLGDISAAMNRSLKHLGYSTYDDPAYKKMVGDGMRVLCERAIGTGNTDDIDKLVELYKNDYLKNCCVNSKPYDGMIELVRFLKENEIKTAILSNKPHDQTVEISDKLFGKDLFDEILGKKDEFPAKPAPDSLMYLIEKFNVKNSETIYIGDSDVDIKLSKAANVYSIGVAWGFRGESELSSEGADKVVFTAAELKDAIFNKPEKQSNMLNKR